MVKNIENPLGAGCRFLRMRDDAAHRIQTAIKATDVGNKCNQYPHRNRAVHHKPNTKAPHNQQAYFGQHGDGRRKQTPGPIELVVDGQVMGIGLDKTLRFAPLLRKRLDHTDTGNGVGQDISDIAPDTVDFFKAGAQTVAHQMNHPRNQWQGQQGRQGQPFVNGK